jgi:hypothetical protein
MCGRSRVQARARHRPEHGQTDLQHHHRPGADRRRGLIVGLVIIIITAVGQGRAKRAARMYQQQMMYPPGQFPRPGR